MIEQVWKITRTCITSIYSLDLMIISAVFCFDFAIYLVDEHETFTWLRMVKFQSWPYDRASMENRASLHNIYIFIGFDGNLSSFLAKLLRWVLRVETRFPCVWVSILETYGFQSALCPWGESAAMLSVDAYNKEGIGSIGSNGWSLDRSLSFHNRLWWDWYPR